MDLLLIVGGFLALIKGADFLVSGASALAKRFNVSDLAIGLTIVAMGTSAPELMVNVLSSQDATQTSLAFGNIIGSSIFNLFLILGVAAIIFPLGVKASVLRKDVPYSIGGLILLIFLVNDTWFGADTNSLSWIDGLILLVLFITYLLHTFINIRRGVDVDEDDEEIVPHTLPKSLFFIVLGMLGLGFGGNWVVSGAVNVANVLQIDQKIIGLTILAGGTSLPELATSAVAALNKKSDLAVGNVVGSNIFNIAMVLSVTSLVTSGNGPMAYEAALNIDMFITLFGMGLLVLFMYTLHRSKIDRSEGAVFLMCFVAYAYLIYTRL